MTNEAIHLMSPPAKSLGRGSGPHKLMTAAEAAILLDMDHRTLIRWARSGICSSSPAWRRPPPDVALL